MTDHTAPLAGKTIVMSGGSRGIGLAIAVRAARDGANVVLIAKTAEPNPRLRGTIYEAAEQIETAGGRALPIVGDIRSDASIAEAVAAAIDTFRSIDICINNASALQMNGTLELTESKYDLMQDINTRGTFMLTRACLPHLVNAENPHVLTLSPPLNLHSKHWLAKFPGYLLSKYGMSLITLSLAAEFEEAGVAVNSLWPRTTIGTDAVRNLLGGDTALTRSRRPEIVADAAYALVTAPSSHRTGELLIDEDVLRESGVTDFAPYSYSDRDDGLEGDFFLD